MSGQTKWTETETIILQKLLSSNKTLNQIAQRLVKKENEIINKLQTLAQKMLKENKSVSEIKKTLKFLSSEQIKSSGKKKDKIKNTKTVKSTKTTKTNPAIKTIKNKKQKKSTVLTDNSNYSIDNLENLTKNSTNTETDKDNSTDTTKLSNDSDTFKNESSTEKKHKTKKIKNTKNNKTKPQSNNKTTNEPNIYELLKVINNKLDIILNKPTENTKPMLKNMYSQSDTDDSVSILKPGKITKPYEKRKNKVSDSSSNGDDTDDIINMINKGRR